ncbi:hypothetical protein K3719_07960 [Leisingera aquaemixtae]|nr:hypothetical protein K3719_07960 [Leisingera aquaemixtae]
MGNYCKHRFAIIEGDGRDVVEASHDVRTVPELVSGTPLEEAITRMRQQEQAIKDAQAELKRIKMGVARIMQGSQEQPEECAPIQTEHADNASFPVADHHEPSNGRSLAGKTVVFTGTLEQLTRSEARQRAEKYGAKVSGIISEKTNILVAGAGATSDRKLAKAHKLGVSVITETEFFAMLS